LHDGNPLNGKNQVVGDSGILEKIRTWILNFRDNNHKREAKKDNHNMWDCQDLFRKISD
jgi:hypothetical protein